MTEMDPNAGESANVAAALALPRALEAGVYGDALRDLYAEAVISVEHPNAISPRGSSSDLDHIVAASKAGAACCPASTTRFVTYARSAMWSSSGTPGLASSPPTEAPFGVVRS